MPWMALRHLVSIGGIPGEVSGAATEEVHWQHWCTHRRCRTGHEHKKLAEQAHKIRPIPYSQVLKASYDYKIE